MTYFFLILALSLDTFTLALSYEADKIQIPLSSNLIISFICSFVLMLSLFLGGFIQNIISPHILKVIAFIILFSIGLFKIFDNRIKNFIKKRNFKMKKINFSFCNLKFILQIYSDYKYADIDKSKTLSSLEAIFLALALSLDSIGAGLAFNPSIPIILGIFIASMLLNFLFILGAKMFKFLKLDYSFLGGLILIVLAFGRL